MTSAVGPHSLWKCKVCVTRVLSPRLTQVDGQEVTTYQQHLYDTASYCRRMPFARIDLAHGKSLEYRTTVVDVIYRGLVDVLKAPEGDRFMVIGEHARENFVYDPDFLGIKRTPDLIIIQVTSTVGNTKEQKVAFFQKLADDLHDRLGVRREDVFISLVFVDREDWSFGNGKPW